jgi:hypothetical protein
MGRREGGFVLYGAVAFMAMALLAFALAWSSRITQNEMTNQSAKYDESISHVRKAITSWYEINAAENSRFSGAFSDAFLQANFARALPVKVNIKSSVLIGQDCTDLKYCAPYHVFAIWTSPRSAVDSSVFNEATGVFIPAPKSEYVVLSTRAVQNALLTKSIKALDGLGARLAQRFSSGFGVTTGHSSVNLFRAQDCSNPTPDEIQCINTYASALASNLHQITNLSPLEMRDAWGGDFLFSNFENSKLDIPFTASLQMITPWGQPVFMTVTQP